MNFAEWHEAYLALYGRHLAPKTLEGYTRLYALLSPLHPIELDAITPEDIQRALIHVEDAAGTRQAQLAFSLLRAELGRAERSRRIPWNPCAALDPPHHTARAGRAITGEDWEQLRPIIEDDIALSLMAYAGLRRGEVLGLLRSDVDLAGQLLHVRRQRVRVHGQLITSTPKSAAGCRSVPITPDLLPILTHACRYCLPSAPLVRCAPETLGHRWQRAQRDAGIKQPYRLHDLRHTFATRLVLAGCNPRVLQYVIGHSDMQLTMRTYTHISAADAAAELSRLAAALH